MTRQVLLVLVLTLGLGGAAFAAGLSPDIALPSDGDSYSALAARAAAHDDSVDFAALRAAYLRSAAIRRADPGAVAALTQEMLAAATSEANAPVIRDKARKILAIDFTDLMAHKLLRQSCAILHDDACAELHHFLEFGLLRSITGSGDGKSCAAGWNAVQIKEEYFLLNMMGAKLVRQALVRDGAHACDALSVLGENGAAQTWYFNIDKMMAAEAASLGLPEK